MSFDAAVVFAHLLTELPYTKWIEFVSTCELDPNDPEASELLIVAAHKTEQARKGLAYGVIDIDWPSPFLLDVDDMEAIGHLQIATKELLNALGQLTPRSHRDLEATLPVPLATDAEDTGYSLLYILKSLKIACDKRASVWAGFIDETRGSGRPLSDRKAWSVWLSHHLNDVFDEYCPVESPTKKRRREFIGIGVTALQDRSQTGWEIGVTPATIKNYLDVELRPKNREEVWPFPLEGILLDSPDDSRDWYRKKRRRLRRC